MNIRNVVKSVIPMNVFRKVEPAGHLVESVLANVRYGFPGKKLRIIGVTGTNGKTTTTFFIHRMLHEAGVKVALMSTVAYGIGDDITMQREHVTTAKASILQKRLKDFAEAGVEWVVLETSSHALAQHRVWGVPYEVAVMTNITHDHIDYHGTFEKYLAAKASLFTIANRHGLRFGVVNAEDQSADAFTREIQNHITYGTTKGDLTAHDIDLRGDGSSYRAEVEGESYDISIRLPGAFNVSNSMAALAVGRKLGLSKQQIERGLSALESVEGRMNAIDEGQSFKALIDFASTPDGFEKFFTSVRPLVKGRLVAVFGSAGRRDAMKRSVQGQIAGKYADIVVITEEDDRDEDGLQIAEQIAEGARKEGRIDGETLFVIPSRTEAIQFALTQVSEGDDMVAFLGKGHEKTIERADGEHDWNEAEVVRAALKSL